QDAHEAIRPTDVTRTPDSLAKYLKPEELKLYRLIWQRFVASQMMPALFDQTTIDIKAGRFIFRATGSVQKFDGFLKVYQEGRDDPTALGKTVNDVLIEVGFDDLFNESYTERMEEELDEIEEGKLKWTDALAEFYDKFKQDLSKFQKYAKEIKEKETPTEEVCLKCGTPGMVMKLGRFGKYLKCNNCGATRDAEPVAVDGDGSSTQAAADGVEEMDACELCS